MANMLHGNARTTQRIRAGFSKFVRKAQRFNPALWAEPNNRHEVALSHDNHRCAYGFNEAQKHGAILFRAYRNISHDMAYAKLIC
jgi:hypothetical protein